MTLQRLKAAMKDKTLLRRVLLRYDGRYSVGVGSEGDEYVLNLHVEPTTPLYDFPFVIDVENEIVRVVVKDDFTVPVLS